MHRRASCPPSAESPHTALAAAGCPLTILQAHREANGGAWPETVAVNLWGLDSIKTKGESGEQGACCACCGHAAIMS